MLLSRNMDALGQGGPQVYVPHDDDLELGQEAQVHVLHEGDIVLGQGGPQVYLPNENDLELGHGVSNDLK